MNQTCELLKKSFYEDEWVLVLGTFNDTWVRKKDGLKLYGDRPFLFLTGEGNNIHIPFYLRPYMSFHLKKGQSLYAAKKFLLS